MTGHRLRRFDAAIAKTGRNPEGAGKFSPSLRHDILEVSQGTPCGVLPWAAKNLPSSRPKIFLIWVLGAFLLFSGFPVSAQTTDTTPVSLYIAPASGTFTVGSTFTASFYLNTGDTFINAVEARIIFPQDKLQVVSPTTGSSFINIWTTQPQYSNTEGTLTFIGAVPSPGVNTSAGLISTVTFRVKTVGTAVIRFSDKSRVLLNDGQGTDALSKTSGAVYTLVLPPPSGPAVSSASHPDQSSWYALDNVELRWATSEAEGYSYMLSSVPIDIPDDISEGPRSSVVYKNVSDGVHYFHIKALRGGVWGGVTHYAVKVDTAPPAEFTPNISPGARTSNRSPIISFTTTDGASGISHYEIGIFPLSSPADQALFIEVPSPYAPQLELGKYDVVIRAYDNAGNVREETQRVNIVNALFRFTSTDGLIISGGTFTIPWLIVWMLILAAIGIVGFYMRTFIKHHRDAHAKLEEGILHDPVIKERLRVLQEKQKQYGKIAIILLCAVISLGMFSPSAQAQDGSLIAPPVITVVSKNISNEDLFYVGGQTPFKNAAIVIYLQDSATGAVSNFETSSDVDGNWFYSHDKFLPAGTYTMWLQTRVGDQLSPPSAQTTFKVTPTAIELGSSRLSYELIYLIIALLLLVVVISQVAVTAYHYSQNKRKRAILADRIKEAEESIRRGFAMLRRDIESELKLIHQAKLRGPLGDSEKTQEETLLKDLEVINDQVGKEIWEIEHMENPF